MDLPNYEIGDLLVYEEKGVGNLDTELCKSHRVFLGFCHLGKSWRWCYPESPESPQIRDISTLIGWEASLKTSIVTIYPNAIHLRDCIIISKSGKMQNSYASVNYHTEGLAFVPRNVDYHIGKSFIDALKLGFQVFLLTMKNRKEWKQREVVGA